MLIILISSINPQPLNKNRKPYPSSPGVSRRTPWPQNLKKIKTFLANEVMPAWPGLIGWYGWHYHDINTCSIILRFSAGEMRDKSEEEVFKKASELFHDQVWEKVETIDYGDASIDMVPRQWDINDHRAKAFGMLPPELSCFYKE